MGDHPEDGPRLTVREGDPGDAPFVVALGAVAFARFGDYAPVMRQFLDSPEVTAFIACRSGRPVGFALVDRSTLTEGFADMVAIAVEATERRSGVGRTLLSHVIASCEARGDASVLVLTVADDNDGAIALFRSMGFSMTPGAIGRYAGGQRSRLMARPL